MAHRYVTGLIRVCRDEIMCDMFRLWHERKSGDYSFVGSLMSTYVRHVSLVTRKKVYQSRDAIMCDMFRLWHASRHIWMNFAWDPRHVTYECDMFRLWHERKSTSHSTEKSDSRSTYELITEPINEYWRYCEHIWPRCIWIVQQYSHFSFILQSPSMSNGVIVNTYGPDVSQMNWNCAECITNCAKCIHNSAHQWEMALLWIHMALMYLNCTTIQPFLIHTTEPINEKWLYYEHIWPLCT